MPIATYLDSNCLIAIADFEIQRRAKVLHLLRDPQRSFNYSPFTTLETLSLAIHYRQFLREHFFRLYLNRCAAVSGNLRRFWMKRIGNLKNTALSAWTLVTSRLNRRFSGGVLHLRESDQADVPHQRNQGHLAAVTWETR